MKTVNSTEPARAVTLQDVVDRLVANQSLGDTRKRDLRSALSIYAKLVGQPLSAIPFDLAAMRGRLDGIVPAQAKVSPKRWANLRSDLSAAITASGLIPMLKTADVALDAAWASVLADKGKVITHGLSRLARWATLRRIGPTEMSDSMMERFFSELDTMILVRDLRGQRRYMCITWNKLADLLADLQRVHVPSHRPPSKRAAWDQLPASFREELEAYLKWCSVPDPLDQDARARALAPETLRLRRDHIHLAASAACAAGVDVNSLTSLARLVEPEVYKALLRRRWEEAGGRFSGYTRDVAVVLISMAGEWVKVPATQMAQLKELRSKLGRNQRGFTEKNKAMLRRFDDERLLQRLVQLPDVLWRAGRHNLKGAKRSFVDLQTALAIDILLHVPLRIENLSELRFDQHIHWPQGPRRPGLLVIDSEDTKNDNALEFELPAVLADRLYAFRHTIAPAVIGTVPDALFVSIKGKSRAISTVRVAIQKAVLRRLGVKLTPHQFRHLCGKIVLDANPGAYELVRQLLGHKSSDTSARYYAGRNTRRAGRAHAALIAQLRENRPQRSRRNAKKNSTE